MTDINLAGAITPLVTPFDTSSSLAVDESALKRLVDYQIEAGSHGIGCTGTTGEPTSMTIAERKRVIEVVIEQVAARVPVLAGTGTNNFDETVELSVFAESAGADALLIVSPYFVRPSAEGLFDYFTAVAATVEVPIILYNIPGRSGVNIDPRTQNRIRTAAGNVAGVKEAVSDIVQVSQDLALCGEDWKVFCGAEAYCFSYSLLGGAGYVSATGNVAPTSVARLYELVSEGKIEDARRLHYDLLDLNLALFLETNPGPLKYLMGEIGLCSAAVRRPLSSPQPPTKEVVLAAARKLTLL